MFIPDIEQALTFYLRDVEPSQRVVHADVLDTFEESVTKNRDLLERLANE
jgi:hypothetical protein